MTAPVHDQPADRRPVYHRTGSPSPQNDHEMRPPTDPTVDSSLPTRPGLPPPAVSIAMAQRLQSTAGNQAVAALLVQRHVAPARPRRTGSPAGQPGTPGGAARAGESGSPAQRVTGLVEGSGTATTAMTDGSGGSVAAGPADAPVVAPLGSVPVQRATAAPDASPRRPGPEADPKFSALKGDVRAKQKTMTTHPPAAAEAAAAARAALPPQDDKQAQGKAANAEKMNAAKPGTFDKAAFIHAVDEAIAAQSPKNLDEADKFGDSGKANAVKDKVAGQVSDGKKTSAGAIETTTKAPPDTSAAKDKPVTPLRPDQPPATPATPNPAKAVPDKAPASATDFSDGPAQVDQQMADAQVTEGQLANSNEPEFTGALKDKKEGEAHAASAPGQVRGMEAQTLVGAKAAAGQAGAATMATLAGVRKTAGTQVTAGKQGAKGSDEAKRAQVTAKLRTVFDATKKDVEDILSGLDKKVDDAFAKGEKGARDAFTAEHKRRMDEYKDKRYSGLIGKGRWLKDKFAGLPEEANQIFVTARQGYVIRMRQVISGVADIIGAELTRAKQRIATGRDQLQVEVRELPADLRAIGKEAAADFTGKFDELTESVDAKGKELVQTLASKYNDALKAVDEEIAKEKEKNKGLVAKAMDAVGGVIKTILQLKDMLLGVLAKAAQAVMAILKDPIGFLGNLVNAVGAGLKAFMANIGEHLKKGLIGWLLGAMAGAGLQLPPKFDLKGILTMVASLLGLTWAAIRGRVVAKGVPEPAMSAVEQSVPVARKLQSEGVAGVTEELKEQVGDLKENLFSKISAYLIPTILIAGITWIISLLNPASAFVKACKMIIDFVSFIINQGAQIIAFVNSVLDAIIAIAGGGGGGVPALIEKALAASIPVLIGALAAILGVSGVANKVKSFFQSLSKPVMKAVDWIVDKIVKLGKALWKKLKGAGKGKADGKTESPAEKSDRLRRAVAEAQALMNGKQRLGLILNARLGAIKRKYELTELRAQKLGDSYAWKIFAKVNPEAEFMIYSLPDKAEALRAVIGARLKSLPDPAYHGEDFMPEVKRIVDGMPEVRKAKASGFALTWERMSADMCVLFVIIDGNSVDPSPIGYVHWVRDYLDMGKMKPEHVQSTWVDHPDAHGEYVLDQGRQMTPRHIVRNTTTADRESIDDNRGIPKKDVRMISEAEHVAGWNGLSPWVSGTTVPTGDVRNPHGELFGGKGMTRDEAARQTGAAKRPTYERIRIDLAYIQPNKIRNLTIVEGQRNFLLSKGTKPDRIVRAVRDATRTQEILIVGAIPDAAITKLYAEDVDAERAVYKRTRYQYFGKGDGILKVESDEDG